MPEMESPGKETGFTALFFIACAEVRSHFSCGGKFGKKSPEFARCWEIFDGSFLCFLAVVNAAIHMNFVMGAELDWAPQNPA